MTWRSEGGFTILEALAAFAILAVFLGLFYEVLGSSARRIERAQLSVQAALIADSQIDLLRARQSEPEWNKWVSLPGGRFTIAYIPVELDGAQDGGLMKLVRLRAVVGWREDGAFHELAVETVLLMKREPGG